MAYFYNNIYNPFSFIGQIIAYAGGSVDPDGWIICDGILRINTNNIYTNLANLGIGTLSNNNTEYTPPDLSGYLLCGSDNTYPVNTFGGVTDNQSVLNQNQLPAHTHGSITTSTAGGAHTHTYDDYYASDVTLPDVARSNGGDGDGNTDNSRTTDPSVYVQHTVSIGLTGGSTPFNFANRSYVINWIIKY